MKNISYSGSFGKEYDRTYLVNYFFILKVAEIATHDHIRWKLLENICVECNLRNPYLNMAELCNYEKGKVWERKSMCSMVRIICKKTPRKHTHTKPHKQTKPQIKPPKHHHNNNKKNKHQNPHQNPHQKPNQTKNPTHKTTTKIQKKKTPNQTNKNQKPKKPKQPKKPRQPFSVLSC